jgi:hypothetical protein
MLHLLLLRPLCTRAGLAFLGLVLSAMATWQAQASRSLPSEPPGFWRRCGSSSRARSMGLVVSGPYQARFETAMALGALAADDGVRRSNCYAGEIRMLAVCPSR